jgi:hypothetical protein
VVGRGRRYRGEEREKSARWKDMNFEGGSCGGKKRRAGKVVEVMEEGENILHLRVPGEIIVV